METTRAEEFEELHFRVVVIFGRASKGLELIDSVTDKL